MRIKTLGKIVIGIGVFIGIISRPLCELLCEVCLNPEIYPCFYLLLFAGILLIFAGYSLTTLKELILPGVRLK